MENDAEYARLRYLMVEEQIARRGIKDKLVIEAMRRVPRHVFIEPSLRSQAYNDYPLAIGVGQTISQPYTVAFMTEALELKGNERVLEIGTGCGYQTAVLLEIVSKVYSIERIASLVEDAQSNLTTLGYTGFEIIVGDGSLGLKERAPFDAIIVTAGSPHVPQSLINQLAIDGRLVIPVGDRYSQTMTRIRRTGDIEFKQEDLGAFRFVGLIGAEGWKD